MLITTARHERIVAAKDAEIAGLMARLNRMQTAHDVGLINEASMLDTIEKQRARLAAFTAPRARNAKGHFLPTKSPVDQVLDALNEGQSDAA